MFVFFSPLAQVFNRGKIEPGDGQSRSRFKEPRSTRDFTSLQDKHLQGLQHPRPLPTPSTGLPKALIIARLLDLEGGHRALRELKAPF